MALFLLFSLAATGQDQLGIQRVGHVVVPVKSLEVSMPFYGNLLGLKQLAVPGNLAASQAWFEIGGGQQIRLIEGRPDAVRPPGTYLALVVGSLKQAERQLRQRGVSVSKQPTAPGRTGLLVADPDGYILEFIESKPEGPGFLQSAAKAIWRSVTDVD